MCNPPPPAGSEPSVSCSASPPARTWPGRLGVPEVVVVVVVVLAVAGLSLGDRPAPAALLVIAAAVADLIAGRRPSGPASRSSRRRSR
ncbi:hypothetical protein ACFYRN_42565 [Streptomyces sp. NPDC005227]|uniref:hypothetical protein n=1 Tax=Streptomyces sp. NPDC005227 TaxID=3364707 RepID=UPI0036B3C3E6